MEKAVVGGVQAVRREIPILQLFVQNWIDFMARNPAQISVLDVVSWKEFCGTKSTNSKIPYKAQQDLGTRCYAARNSAWISAMEGILRN